MSTIKTDVGEFTIDHEVPYLQYVIYGVDDTGETNYLNQIYEFDQERAESTDGYWNITYKDQLIENVVDSVSYEKVVEYIEYLAGWFETHPDDVIEYSVFALST